MPILPPVDDQPLALSFQAGLFYFLRGLRSIVSVPAFALAGGFLGYGALTQDFGWPLWAAVAGAVMIFAIPAQLVLATALHAGAGIVGAAILVTLSAVRLLPMVVVIMPIIRGDLTRKPVMLVASHLTAVTAWVEGMRIAPSLPRPARMPFFLGLGLGLMIVGAACTALGYKLSGALPTALAIGLFAITPIYFFLSLHRGARDAGDVAALLLGFLLSPLVTFVAPGWELLLAGLAGGSLAFLFQRMLDRRRHAA